MTVIPFNQRLKSWFDGDEKSEFTGLQTDFYHVNIARRKGEIWLEFIPLPEYDDGSYHLFRLGLDEETLKILKEMSKKHVIEEVVER